MKKRLAATLGLGILLVVAIMVSVGARSSVPTVRDVLSTITVGDMPIIIPAHQEREFSFASSGGYVVPLGFTLEPGSYLPLGLLVTLYGGYDSVSNMTTWYSRIYNTTDMDIAITEPIPTSNVGYWR